MRDDLIAQQNKLVLDIVEGVIAEYRRLNGSGWFDACASKVREAIMHAALAAQGGDRPRPDAATLRFAVQSLAARWRTHIDECGATGVAAQDMLAEIAALTSGGE